MDVVVVELALQVVAVVLVGEGVPLAVTLVDRLSVAGMVVSVVEEQETTPQIRQTKILLVVLQIWQWDNRASSLRLE